MNTLYLPTVKTFVTHTDTTGEHERTYQKFMDRLGNPKLHGDFKQVAAYLAGEAVELGLPNLAAWFDNWSEHIRERISSVEGPTTVKWF